MTDKNMQSCFIQDMDANFVVVPKNWVNKLIIMKLMNLCISLANEMRLIKVEDFTHDQIEEEKGEEAAAE